MSSMSGPHCYSQLFPIITDSKHWGDGDEGETALLEGRNLKQIPNLYEGWEVICRNPLEEYIKIYLSDLLLNRFKHVLQDRDTLDLHIKGLSMSIYFVSR